MPGDLAAGTRVRIVSNHSEDSHHYFDVPSEGVIVHEIMHSGLWPKFYRVAVDDRRQWVDPVDMEVLDPVPDEEPGW